MSRKRNWKESTWTLFSSDESTEEFDDNKSFRETFKDTLTNGWEELCDEGDEEMIDLTCNLDGKVLFAMAKAARKGNTDADDKGSRSSDQESILLL